MSTMALEVAPFCTRVLAPFYLRVSTRASLAWLVLNLGVDLAGGGEVATTAAVYGQLAGAHYGHSAIRQDLTFFDPLD